MAAVFLETLCHQEGIFLSCNRERAKKRNLSNVSELNETHRLCFMFRTCTFSIYTASCVLHPLLFLSLLWTYWNCLSHPCTFISIKTHNWSVSHSSCPQCLDRASSSCKDDGSNFSVVSALVTHRVVTSPGYFCLGKQFQLKSSCLEFHRVVLWNVQYFSQPRLILLNH